MRSIPHPSPQSVTSRLPHCTQAVYATPAPHLDEVDEGEGDADEGSKSRVSAPALQGFPSRVVRREVWLER